MEDDLIFINNSKEILMRKISNRISGILRKCELTEQKAPHDHMFLTRDYFKHHNEFHRHQDINPKYFSTDLDSKILFISHRWVSPDKPDSPIDPMVNVQQTQFHKVKHHLMFTNCEYVWYDYSCMPQHPRTEADQVVFKERLRSLNKMLSKCYETLSICSDDYGKRSWCVAELSMSGYVTTGPWGIQSSGSTELFLTKFDLMYISWVIGLLVGNNKLLKLMINYVMSKTQVTNGADKQFLIEQLTEHFEMMPTSLKRKNDGLRATGDEQFCDQYIRNAINFLSGNLRAAFVKGLKLILEQPENNQF